MSTAESGDLTMQLTQATLCHLSRKDKHLLQPRTKTAGVHLPFYTSLKNNQELPQLISLYDNNLLRYRTKVVGADLPQGIHLVLQNIRPSGQQRNIPRTDPQIPRTTLSFTLGISR
jgi:hypothetical protein